MEFYQLGWEGAAGGRGKSNNKFPQISSKRRTGKSKGGERNERFGMFSSQSFPGIFGGGFIEQG